MKKKNSMPLRDSEENQVEHPGATGMYSMGGEKTPEKKRGTTETAAATRNTAWLNDQGRNECEKNTASRRELPGEENTEPGKTEGTR